LQPKAPSVGEAEVNLPFITADASGPKHFVTKLSRAKLESLVDSLIERTIEPCRKALKDAGLDKSKISEVILVGGQTRMPKVQETVKNFFGKEPHKGVNPGGVVCMGAISPSAAASSGAISPLGQPTWERLGGVRGGRTWGRLRAQVSTPPATADRRLFRASANNLPAAAGPSGAACPARRPNSADPRFQRLLGIRGFSRLRAGHRLRAECLRQKCLST
jgi:hypothetical protein